MEIEEIAGNLNNTASICEDIINNDKKGQMDALLMQVESLNNTIAHKNKQIQILKSQVDGSLEKVNNFVEFLQSDSKSEDRDELLNAIQNENNIEEKLDSLFKLVFIDYNSTKNTSGIISRMKAQLYGNIELLTRLNESKDCQEKFFEINDESNASLSKETKKLIEEQAKHTSLILESIKSEEKDENEVSTIANVFDKNFDGEKRIKEIKELLLNSDVKNDEVKDLLIQEVTATSVLSRYIDNLVVRVEDFDEKSKFVFEKLCNALGTQQEYSPEQFLELTQALANDCLKARQKAGLEIGGFTSYLKKSDKAIYKLAKKLEQAQTLVQKQSDEIEKAKLNSSGKWAEWGSNLYVALLGFGEQADDETMRLTIETAALTSVGKLRKSNKRRN